jgi:hypothetical protein
MLNTYIRLVCKTCPWSDASTIRQKQYLFFYYLFVLMPCLLCVSVSASSSFFCLYSPFFLINCFTFLNFFSSLMILCAILLCSIAHSIICARLFRRNMHSDWFNGTEILQGRWQHGEKVGYCYPSGFEKTLYKCDIYIYICPAGHKRVNHLVSVTLYHRTVWFQP